MNILTLGKRIAARFGVHADRLSRQPETQFLGLVHRPIDLIVDVGANTGQFARDIRARFPRAHIVSFEPNPVPYAELSAWARADGNATAINCALGEEEAMLDMHVHTDHSPSSSLLPTTTTNVELFPQTAEQHVQQVRVRRLDDVLAEIGHPAGPDTFLKLDVQGFEEMVLRGAPLTLATAAALMTEVPIDQLYQGQTDFFTLYQTVTKAGLRYGGNMSQFLAPDGHVVFLDAFFVR
ncbi:MAG: FkbM family methyltransferase [Sphingomonadales bacterium]|nr:FkbM family methyltransferase [Sphingomonadales bacterium]